MLSSNKDLLTATNDTSSPEFAPPHDHHLANYGLAQSSPNDSQGQTKKREVYRYQTNWLISSLAWSNEPNDSFNLAISSYIEDYNNYVQIIRLARDAYEQELENITSFDHPYPATKILWIPQPPNNINARLPRLIATTADYLRLWRVEQETFESFQNSDSNNKKVRDNVRLECLLNNNKGIKHCDPLTSFDWNEIDPSIIVTASVDTTVAVWDIEVGKQIDNSTTSFESCTSLTSDSGVTCNLNCRLSLHEQEIYDVSFSRAGSGKDLLASAGADGCVRLFDLRGLKSSSTILYEANRTTLGDKTALVRVACNKQDANLISAFAINSNEMLILDVRYAGKGPLAVLNNHTCDINGMSWAPHSAHHICSASDDQQALIWELSKLPNPIEEPLLAYRANGKINAISWSASQSDWIAIGYENYLELLRV